MPGFGGLGDGGAAEVAELAGMRDQACEEGGVDVVGDVIPFAGAGDELGDFGVVEVRDVGEEVVFGLEVEAAEVPGEDFGFGGEVDGGLHLVNGPGFFHVAGGHVGEGVGGIIDDVGELEDGGHDQAGDAHGDEVPGEDGERAVEEAGEADGEGHEDDFAEDEGDEVKTFGAVDRVIADAGANDVAEVIDEVPFDGDDGVEEPEVDVLPAVEPVAALFRGEAGEGTEFDVVIVADDVGVGVVEFVVFDVPDVGGAADEVEGEGHEPVDIFFVGVGFVAGVVLDVEADASDSEAEGEGGEHGHGEVVGEEDESDVGGEDPEEDGGGFGEHAPAAVAGFAGHAEVAFDAGADILLEGVALAETDGEGFEGGHV